MTTIAAGVVAQVVARWAHLYNDTKTVNTAVTYVHFAGMLVGGGFAVVADRDAFRLSQEAAASPAGLADLASVHAWVLGGLILVFVSGFLMMFADLHTYMTSPAFWTKMGLIVLVLGNGYARVRAESALRRGAPAAWTWLRRTSVASLILWLAVLLASTILNA
jgi:hypothetical protein